MQISSNYINVNTYDRYNSNKKDPNLKNENDKNKEDKKTQVINGKELDEAQIRQVRELEKTDREVRAHEAAHQGAGGGLAGGASFTYTKGPDNKMYAVAGEVPIKMQTSSDPNQTIANARAVVAAAMAPSNPSPQDYKVAANAVKMEMQARAELTKMKAQEQEDKKEKFQQNQEEQNSQNNTNNKNEKAIKAYEQTTKNSYIDSNLINIAS